MKPAIAPTSPKNKPPSPVAEVWNAAQLQQPHRTPWGRFVIIVVLFSVVIAIGLMVGAVWLQRYGPVGWWTKWLPMVTTTTVVQTVSTKATSDAPKAVRAFAESLTILATAKGETDAYGREDIQNVAAPLSDNGWMVTLQRPPSADGSAMVALRSDGDIEPVTAWISDPSSSFVFAQAGPTNDLPATFGDIAKSVNQTVWVVTAVLRDQVIVPRRLVSSDIPAWPSSDRLERTYHVDGTVTSGSYVVSQTGQCIGMVADDGRIWSVTTLQSILKDIIQTGRFERTALGVRARRQDEMVVPKTPTAAGWVIGNGADQTAVEENSAAARAGIKSGDVIVSIDNQAPTGDLFETIQRWQPGETAVVTIDRAGSEREVTVEFTALRP